MNDSYPDPSDLSLCTLARFVFHLASEMDVGHEGKMEWLREASLTLYERCLEIDEGPRVDFYKEANAAQVFCDHDYIADWKLFKCVCRWCRKVQRTDNAL